MSLDMPPNDKINPIFSATIEATEEAILHAMVAAESMTGAYYLHQKALPHDELRKALRKYDACRNDTVQANPSLTSCVPNA